MPSGVQHTDPDYSAAYVVLEADSGLKGFGITFTLGRGTDIGEGHAPASRPAPLRAPTRFSSVAWLFP